MPGPRHEVRSPGPAGFRAERDQGPVQRPGGGPASPDAGDGQDLRRPARGPRLSGTALDQGRAVPDRRRGRPDGHRLGPPGADPAPGPVPHGCRHRLRRRRRRPALLSLHRPGQGRRVDHPAGAGPHHPEAGQGPPAAPGGRQGAHVPLPEGLRGGGGQGARRLQRHRRSLHPGRGRQPGRRLPAHRGPEPRPDLPERPDLERRLPGPPGPGQPHRAGPPEGRRLRARGPPGRGPPST